MNVLYTIQQHYISYTYIAHNTYPNDVRHCQKKKKRRNKYHQFHETVMNWNLLKLILIFVSLQNLHGFYFLLKKNKIYANLPKMLRGINAKDF